MVSNSGTGIMERQTGILFCNGYLKSAKVWKVVSGFSATGIVPLGSQVFSEEYLLPAAATDRITGDRTSDEVAIDVW
jgi:hypothetical protein